MLLTLEGERKLRQLTGITLRVVVDGCDVTGRCVSADAQSGWALCYATNSEGHKYVGGDGGPVMEILTGHVRFVRKPDNDAA